MIFLDHGYMEVEMDIHVDKPTNMEVDEGEKTMEAQSLGKNYLLQNLHFKIYQLLDLV